MIRIATVALFLLTTIPLHAQEITVISGEHSDFTRLVVLDRDLDENWEFGRVADGYSLRLSNGSFDLGNVFDRIPRKRLEQIESPLDGQLDLTITCECYAKAYKISEGLVIDIIDGVSPADSPFEVSLDVQTPEPMEPVAQDLPEQEPVLAIGERVVFEALVSRGLDDRGELDQLEQLEVTRSEKIVEKMAEGPSIIRTDRAIELQQELLSQLSRAAIQGLVTPDLAETETMVAKTDPEVQEMPSENPPAETSLPEQIIPEEGLAHVRLETSVDRGFGEIADVVATTVTGGNCIPNEWLDIGSWGDAENSELGLSPMSAQLVEEFDATNDASVIALVQNYLFLTFGAEAKATLSAFDVDSPYKSLMLEIADIMDNGRVERSVISADQLQCDTNAAMWAMFSPSADSNVNVDSVVTSFGGLPIHLRRHLGPELAKKFLELGNTETSAIITGLIERAPGDPGDGVKLVNAEISLEEGDATEADEILEELVLDDSTKAAEALITLIDSTLDRDDVVSKDYVTRALSMAAEARGTEIGNQLVRVALRGRIQTDNLIEVRNDVYDQAEANVLTDEEANSLNFEIFERMLKNSSEEEFLKMVLGSPSGLDDSERGTSLKRQVAQKLLDFNLPAQARDVLAENQALPSEADRKLIAKSYLIERRPDMAMGYLAGLEDDDSMQMRAVAETQAGQFENAAQVYSELGNEDARNDSLWRNKDWLSTAQNASGTRKQVAEFAQTTPIEMTELSLATSNDILSESARVRNALSSLLEEIGKP